MQIQVSTQLSGILVPEFTKTAAKRFRELAFVDATEASSGLDRRDCEGQTARHCESIRGDYSLI